LALQGKSLALKHIYCWRRRVPIIQVRSSLTRAWYQGDDSSPASFEKSLSTLSKKIGATQLQLDKQRSSSRRVKFLGTLYLSIAYLIYAIVLLLVVGQSNLGPWDWTGLAGGPVVLYLYRTLSDAYFTFRVDKLEEKLKYQQGERAKIIQKLKDATKYDTTLELLEKYGGEKPKPKRTKSQQLGDGDEHGQKGQQKNKMPGQQGMSPGGRLNIPPPPTANIQRPSTSAGTPQNQQRQGPYPLPSRPQTSNGSREFSANFAPNAEEMPPSYHQYDFNTGPPKWYDRVLDLMMGEDETAPKNRIVLICQNCRLVNGQAPPGTKSLADVGQWKCMGCGNMNGEMDEGKKIIQDVLGQSQGVHEDEPSSAASGNDTESDRAETSEKDMEKEIKAVRRSGRNKSQMVP
jgi:endoplasmic reticulum junction formation protein lunapark